MVAYAVPDFVRQKFAGLFPIAMFLSLLSCLPSVAQESPYIVTYDHYLEEPGSLEV